MTSKVAVMCVDATEPRRVADFWCQVLGWQIVEESAEGIAIAAPDGSWPSIDILAVPDRKSVKNRLHLDLRADGVTTEAELQRLRELGARDVDVGQDPDVTWTVLADPEGNEFCLLLRTVQDMQAHVSPANWS